MNETGQEVLTGWRLGMAANGDQIIVDPVQAAKTRAEYFLDEHEYATADDATIALLAYKLRFGLFLSATDRCKIAHRLNQTIER
jgi:hypothetical protein